MLIMQWENKICIWRKTQHTEFKSLIGLLLVNISLLKFLLPVKLQARRGEALRAVYFSQAQKTSTVSAYMVCGAWLQVTGTVLHC